MVDALLAANWPAPAYLARLGLVGILSLLQQDNNGSLARTLILHDKICPSHQKSGKTVC